MSLDPTASRVGQAERQKEHRVPHVCLPANQGASKSHTTSVPDTAPYFTYFSQSHTTSVPDTAPSFTSLGQSHITSAPDTTPSFISLGQSHITSAPDTAPSFTSLGQSHITSVPDTTPSFISLSQQHTTYPLPLPASLTSLQFLPQSSLHHSKSDQNHPSLHHILLLDH
ncbi:hypothetical protein Pcinc_033853 [Petrolisthes cinctipes]|uniref:Uncharacterized protein n=1 Tax=Petrolisthes cinctipes TaxID=88211 RepID=A0AAE1ERF5_PETCI|nr:hypothetical protein Pcinc_033853 [Petrolisthes cinctipes]